jgi:RNA polymerase sigma-70 factor (sigma-E family)
LVATEGAPVRGGKDFDELDELVATRGNALLATATLLAGSRTAGEDLLQAALERVMRRWGHVRGDPEGYVRRTLYHLAVDQWRVRRRRPEVHLTVEPPAPDEAGRVQLRHALVQAMGQLQPRQRAVLVLRYWEQLSEAEAAEVLGCSVGTVKSSASRGLARLRELTADWNGDAGDRTLTPNGATR